jgi:hypothetical protein
MKKIIIVLSGVCLMLHLNSCKPKAVSSGDVTCIPTGKYLKDGSFAEYDLPASTNNDTSVKQIYSGVTANIFQQKDEYLNSAGTKTSDIPFYLKGCDSDVYINNIGYGMDAQIAANNYYIKGIRKVGTTWTYMLNGTKYYCGCASVAEYIKTPYDTLWADKIWMRNQAAEVPCDTLYWNDTIGLVAKYGVSKPRLMMKKNY